MNDYVAAAVEAFGAIDGFFNNAGIEGTQNLTEDFGATEFARVLSVNLNGAFYGMAAVLPVMRRQGHGSIVNTASVGGIRGIGNQSGYSASKHGVVGLTRNSAVEYGQFGISINAIAPGAIMTPMVEASLKQINPDKWQEVGEQFVSVNPMQRFGNVTEVAALAAFLLSGRHRSSTAPSSPSTAGSPTSTDHRPPGRHALLPAVDASAHPQSKRVLRSERWSYNVGSADGPNAAARVPRISETGSSSPNTII